MRMPVSVTADELSLFLLQFHLEADGGKEGFKMLEEILLGHSGFELEQIQQLSLHQVHFSQPESESLISLDGGVSGPMLVLGAGVVEILCC